MFFNSNAKPFLSQSETELVMEAIRENEKDTSGEIRICVEKKCPYVDPLDRARELFYQLKMYETTHRNAILIYIAYGDHDFALFGDGAIHNKVKETFWKEEAKRLSFHFYNRKKAEGIIAVIKQIGEEFKTHFPFTGAKKNELPDEIVFGK